MYSAEEVAAQYQETTDGSRYLAPKTTPTSEFNRFWRDSFDQIDSMPGVTLE